MPSISTIREIYSQQGLHRLYKEGVAYACESVVRTLEPYLSQQSEYVLDKEWDVLLIMDACRVDALEEIADEYDFIPDPPHNTIWSAASCSEGWLRENFKNESGEKFSQEMSELVYISGNPHTEMFDGSEFQRLENVYGYGWNEDEGYMPPEPLTDRAIKYHREESPNRMIVHYMQPHAPFLSDHSTSYKQDIDTFTDDWSVDTYTPWERYRDGKLSKSEIWEAYLDTLRVGLDSVETLLENLDAERVVISADHGNAMGEWGIYGHPPGMPITSLRSVPWVVTSAEDTGEYEVQSFDTEQEDVDVSERLEHLGYK